MNTQQISDFVKQEISKGATKERITQVLLINGVSQTEINQALSGWEINAPVVPPPPISSRPPPQMMAIPISPPPPVPLRKSHIGLIVTTVILLLLIAASGASAYIYKFQLDLVKEIPVLGELLFPVPTPEEAMAKMLENLPQVKSLSYDINFTGSGTIPTSTTTDSAGNFSLQISGKGDMTDISNPKNGTTINAQGKVDSEGMQISADFGASIIVLDKTFYGQINRLPTFIPIPQLSAITGQWIKIDPEVIASSAHFSLTPSSLTSQEIESLRNEILAAQPLAFGAFIGKEKIGDKQTYNYPIIFFKPGLKKVIDVITSLAEKYQEKTGLGMTATSTRIMRAEIETMKFYIDDTDFPEGKIWIGQDDFLPYKIAFEDVNLAKINLSLIMEYHDYNQPVEIAAPDSFKTFEEIMKETMATSTST